MADPVSGFDDHLGSYTGEWLEKNSQETYLPKYVPSAPDLPMIRLMPKTDAFDVKFQWDYPKEMSESRKHVIFWQLLCFIMIYMCSLLITLDGGISSNSDLFFIFGLFVIITLFATGLSYHYGIGVVDIVYPKFGYLFKMQLTLHIILFLSPILMYEILLEGRSADAISNFFEGIYVALADINLDVAETVVFFLFFPLTLLPYFIIIVPLFRYWGIDFEKNWRNIIRGESSPEKERRRKSNSLALGIITGGICFLISGWMMLTDPRNVDETVNSNPSIIGEIVLFVGVEIIGGAFLLLAIIMIVFSLFYRNTLEDLDNH